MINYDQQQLPSKEDDGYIEENEDDDGQYFEKEDSEEESKFDFTIKKQEDNNLLQFHEVISIEKDSFKPLPLVATGHSLVPDLKFGWKPEADKETPPIPLCFGFISYDLEQFNYQKVIYVGPRFVNTYKMHEQYANKQQKIPITQEEGQNNSVNSYTFLFPKHYETNQFSYEKAFTEFIEQIEDDESILDQNLNYLNPLPQYQNLKDDKIMDIINKKGQYYDVEDELIFDSNFESGNLDFVGKINENEFDLIMRADTNSRADQCWYFFSMECSDKCKFKKGSLVKINILNFTKPNSLYNQGMKPVAWSKEKYSQDGFGWHRAGQNIQYKPSKLTKSSQSANSKIYYTVSFEYTFEYDQDKVWLAYAIPYTYTMQMNFIKSIEEIQQKPENKIENLIFKKEIIGRSLSGVEIPLLTITDFSENNKRKKTVLICGRLHPGETHSSWLIHGLIRFLLSENYKAQDLRRRIVFKIVPMLNPDGVVIGNYRTTLAGCDLNRNFGDKQASSRINPEAFSFKKLANQQQRLAFFFDIHSHSSKKSIFIYGPYFPLHSEHYLKLRILPKLIQQKTQMFRYYSCRFRNEPHKVNSVRHTLCRNFNLPQCYTIETSIMGFLNKDRQTINFGISSLQYFGEKFGETILDWFLIMEQHQREKIKKAILMSKQRKTKKRTVVDILGEEDYEEFREVINNQLENQEQKQQKKIRVKSSFAIKKVKKRKQQQKVLKSAQSQEFKETDDQQLRDIIKSSIQDNDSDDEMTTSHQFALNPKIFRLQTTKDNNSKTQLTNKGFNIPRLAGFEYIEGPEKKRQEAMKKESNKLDQFIIEDDSMYIFEDQANHQEGDQPLKRLEDIVGEIKKDLVKKSNMNVNEFVQIPGQMHNQDQLYNESDLDSQKGGSSDNEEIPKEQDQVDQDCLRIQNILETYLDSIENSALKKSKRQFNFKDKILSKQLQKPKTLKDNITEITKPTNYQFQTEGQTTPLRQRKILINNNTINEEKRTDSTPQRKEVIYQVKNHQVINNNMKRLRNITSESSKRQYKRNIQGVFYQHQTANNAIDQDLSYTLTHKTNHEFFDLLKRYIHNGGNSKQFDINAMLQDQQQSNNQGQIAFVNLGSRNAIVNEIQKIRDEQQSKTQKQKIQAMPFNKQRGVTSHSNTRGSQISSKINNRINMNSSALSNQHQNNQAQAQQQNDFSLYVEGQQQQQKIKIPISQSGNRVSLNQSNLNMRLKSQKPSLKDILSSDFDQNILMSQHILQMQEEHQNGHNNTFTNDILNLSFNQNPNLSISFQNSQQNRIIRNNKQSPTNAYQIKCLNNTQENYFSNKARKSNDTEMQQQQQINNKPQVILKSNIHIRNTSSQQSRALLNYQQRFDQNQKQTNNQQQSIQQQNLTSNQPHRVLRQHLKKTPFQINSFYRKNSQSFSSTKNPYTHDNNTTSHDNSQILANTSLQVSSLSNQHYQNKQQQQIITNNKIVHKRNLTSSVFQTFDHTDIANQHLQQQYNFDQNSQEDIFVQLQPYIMKQYTNYKQQNNSSQIKIKNTYHKNDKITSQQYLVNNHQSDNTQQQQQAFVKQPMKNQYLIDLFRNTAQQAKINSSYNSKVDLQEGNSNQRGKQVVVKVNQIKVCDEGIQCESINSINND